MGYDASTQTIFGGFRSYQEVSDFFVYRTQINLGPKDGGLAAHVSAKARFNVFDHEKHLIHLGLDFEYFSNLFLSSDPAGQEKTYFDFRPSFEYEYDTSKTCVRVGVGLGYSADSEYSLVLNLDIARLFASRRLGAGTNPNIKRKACVH